MLSLVIPTLNAERELAATLASLGTHAPIAEVVVADGGSRDGTVAVARAAGARVVEAPRGRGSQLRAGAAASSSPWILFLHADTRLEASWRAAVVRHLATRPDAAGYFRFALDDPAPQARRVERLTRWRCRALAMPYGDQGLLIARTLYESIDGFAPVPLMEDVDLVRRLGRARLVALPAMAVTSAARYRRDGWWARPLRNLALLSLWRLGVPPTTLARLYG
jgi:rSAM/selenodomain-associated transferase 2